FRTQSGETLAQFGGNFLGNFLGQQVMGGDPASTNLGTQIGALAGPSVFGSTLGSFGGPVGAVVGGMLGGLFGRRRNPEDEELRRWRDGVLRGISNMDKSLRFQNDMWRAVRGEQLTGVASRFLGNRYNSSASREASLGVA
ncbi:MAG: glycine zipper domain-containing protein, partial [Bacteroidota bacterium]